MRSRHRAVSRIFILSIILAVSPLAARGADPSPAPATRPAFALRGIKGLWWEGIDKYRRALPWVAKHDMNFLMFCYSSFPASGKEWRSDYTADEQAGFRDLAQQAKSLGVELCLSFNPGIWSKPPLTYSSEADYQIAWNKVKSVHGLGVHSFALCLDDINTQLQPGDAQRFKTLEAAQVYFTNRLWNDMKSLSPRPRFIFCPSAYTTGEAEKHLAYIQKIAELDPDIFVFWTGPQVCSPTITAADADRFAKWIGRKPIIWDNYPVNDMFPWRPLMAPVKGRSADLGDAVVGIMANPMKQWEASKIPLATLAAYLRDPQHYDPARAETDAVDEYPPEQRDAIRALLSCYGTAFISEAGYPPTSRDAKRLHALKGAMTKTPGLEPLWMDIQPTLDADLAAARK